MTQNKNKETPATNPNVTPAKRDAKADENDYYIIFNPLTFTLMDFAGQCASPPDLLSILTGRDASGLSEKNYLDYLDLDLQKQRIGLIEMLGVESYAMIYIANQVARLEPGARVILCDGKRKTIKKIIQTEKQKPRAIFITTMSSNFPAAVLAAIPLNHARIPVIIGGIHVSATPEDVDIFIRRHVPNPGLVSLVRGAGDSGVLETILRDLKTCRDWKTKTLKPFYTGSETMQDGIWGQKNILPMEPLKLPLLKKIPIIGRWVSKRFTVNPITPYLGCPYCCSFCSISTLPPEQRRFKTRSPEDFVAELEYYQRDGLNSLNRVYFFLPDNLLLGKKTLDKILDLIIEKGKSGLVINFAAQISIDVALQENLLAKLRLAGCTHFIVGFESLDIRNLESIGKHVLKDIKASGLSVNDFYAQLIRKIQAFGISVHGAFIFGLPFDHFNSFEDNTAQEVIRFCLDNHIGLQSTCLTDLPGSLNYRETREAGRFLYGAPGTMDYLLSLSITDLSEGNRPVPAGLKSSPLIVAYMAYESAQRVGAKSNALRNAFYMSWKALRCTTQNGKRSIFKRLYETFLSFGNQWINSLYSEGYKAVAFSSPTVKGTIARLYEAEHDPEVKELFKNLVKKFY